MPEADGIVMEHSSTFLIAFNSILMLETDIVYENTN
jgi:hypothetical protein